MELIRKASTVAVTTKRPITKDFVYGSGYGRTGSLFTKSLREGKAHSFWKPHQILYFNSRSIRQIAAGFGFSVFASHKKLYGGGVDIFSNEAKNASYWSKGLCLNPSDIDDTLNGITGLSAGRRHFLVATKNAVYAFGDNSHGQCGQNPETKPFVRLDEKPYQKILVPSESHIAQVHCTLDTSFVVTESGEVFSFGLGTDGQLGRGVCASDWHCQRVEGDLNQVGIRSLRGSSDTLMAVSKVGQLFMWGQNEYGQMNPFVDSLQSGFAREIRLPLKSLLVADSTATSCVALNEQGCVFVWGFGILGMGPDVTWLKRPAQLHANLFSGGPGDAGEVKQIFAGNTSMFAISKAENLFSWGINRFAHLGLSHDKDQYFPYQVSVMKKPIAVSVAPDHALFIMR